MLLESMKGALIATAAASLFACGGGQAQRSSAAPMAAGGDMVHCGGINACKGQGSCAGAENACKAQNSCKGKGYVETSAADCQAKGGSVVTMK